MKRYPVRRALRRCWRGEQGQALVEFALVTPLILIMFFGMVEFANAWRTYQGVTDAAREAARNAAVANSTITHDSVIGLAKASLQSLRLDPNVAIGTNYPVATGAALTVTIDYPYTFTFITPLLQWATSQSSVTLHTTSVMRKE